jgi:hypothetical protein
MTVDEAMSLRGEPIIDPSDAIEAVPVLQAEVRRLREDQEKNDVALRQALEIADDSDALRTAVQRIIVSLSKRLDGDVHVIGPKLRKVLQTIRAELEKALRGES